MTQRKRKKKSVPLSDEVIKLNNPEKEYLLTKKDILASVSVTKANRSRTFCAYCGAVKSDGRESEFAPKPVDDEEVEK